jgi:prolyl oligopeptidase
MDLNPTLATPDTDPHLWLEDVDGARALAWVADQNARTLARFNGPDVATDQDALAGIMDRSDNIPFVVRRNGQLYNTWKDATHVRGLWRRTSLESYQTDHPDWETVLDFDALAEAEGEDWVFQGAGVIPETHDRAMLRFSRGGGDAAVLREFDLTTCSFIKAGFVAPEAKGGVDWFDRDTLLLSSALGEGQATTAGYARTVRIWRRGSDPLAAPVIFETTPDHMAAGVQVDDEDPAKRLIFIDRTDFFNCTLWLGDLTGPKTRLDLPSDIGCLWHRGWFALRPRTPWTIEGTTYAPGTMLGIGLEAYLAGSRAFEILFTPAPRRTSSGFFWANGRLVVGVMDNLAPSHEIFTPSETGWAREILAHMPSIGVVSISRLDEDETQSDGSLLANVQDPLTPARLMLTSVTSTPPIILKRAPTTFNAEGLVVTRHEAISIDGERIPYIQVGPPGETGEAPVHMTGYGGFNVSEQPYYRSAIGKVWLERGGTSVVTHIRGGGEFGPRWHDAGKREGKALSHDDFAAIAADLVSRGVTRPGRIAAEGGSNGGILITNMLTRYPERFGALFCTIPLVDMRRYTKLLAGASWIAEYGDPDKPEDWAFLQHISAYHTVSAEGPAPPILLATTRRDDRVHPGHARKMAAKLQELGRRAWFYELDTGGHSYGKTNRERAFFVALGYAFLRDGIGWRDHVQ